MTSDYKATLTAFGKALRGARIQAGLTQERLADRSGVDRTYVSGAERGVRNPSLITIVRLCQGLEIPIAELFVKLGASNER